MERNAARLPPADPVIDTSIVVATCSRLPLLQGALASLLAQTWARDHPIELVVIDDRSTDGTAPYLAQLAATAALPVRVVAGPASGIAAARNAGFSAARGRWIASFDDDQVADPHWLHALRTRADQQAVACVGGALTLRLPEPLAPDHLGARVRAVLGEHLPYRLPQPYRPPFQPATNNVLLRRDLFLASFGFDIRFTEGGEDKELFRRLEALGHSVWYEPAATAAHITPPQRLELPNLRWTSRRLGASDARFDRLRGPRGTVRPVLLRLLTLLVRDLPSLLFGRRGTRLDALCSLWYTEGLLRAHLALLAPRRAPSRFLASLNFRTRNGEREASPNSPDPALPSPASAP